MKFAPFLLHSVTVFISDVDVEKNITLYVVENQYYRRC